MATQFHARAYGLQLSTPWSILPSSGSGKHEVDVRFRLVERFDPLTDPIMSVADGWYRADLLRDDRIRFTWPGLFECLLSADGGDVAVSALGSGSDHAFTTHLFGHVLSFALLRKAIEPLHATVLAHPDGAIGILGDSGFGKSTLAAGLIDSGLPLVTDDLLVLLPDGDDLLAQPGLPRLKLWPEAAARFFPDAPSQVVSPGTDKRILPLDGPAWAPTPIPLKVLYVLRRPVTLNVTSRVTIRSMTQAKAFVELTRNTFNALLVDPARLQGQFAFASDLAARVPLRSLTYPPGFDELHHAVERVLEDASK